MSHITLGTKRTGERSAGNPHAPFERAGAGNGARATAPAPDPTDSDDLCLAFDDELDSDHDGVPNGCDTCAGSDDDLDDNGFADACDQVLWWIQDAPRQITGDLPFQNPRAHLVFDRDATTTPYVKIVLVEPTPYESTVSVVDAETLDSVEVVLRNPLTQYTRTQFRYDRSGGGGTTVAFSTTADPGITFAQITRIVFIGYAMPDGWVRMRWELRGY